MKKVVYTAILEGYDDLKKINKQDGWDYLAFIDPYDKYKNKDTNWTILPISEDILNMDINKYKKQRYLKMHPHLLFPNHTISLYIEGNFEIDGDLNEFLIRLLTPNYNIYIVEHFGRNFIYKEMKEVLLLDFLYRSARNFTPLLHPSNSISKISKKLQIYLDNFFIPNEA